MKKAVFAFGIMLCASSVHAIDLSPKYMKALREDPVYSSGSALFQQIMEERAILTGAPLVILQTKLWPQQYAKAREYEAQAINQARIDAGYASQSAAFKDGFDRMLRSGEGRWVKFANGQFGYEYTRSSVLAAQMAGQLNVAVENSKKSACGCQMGSATSGSAGSSSASSAAFFGSSALPPSGTTGQGIVEAGSSIPGRSTLKSGGAF